VVAVGSGQDYFRDSSSFTASERSNVATPQEGIPQRTLVFHASQIPELADAMKDGHLRHEVTSHGEEHIVIDETAPNAQQLVELFEQVRRRQERREMLTGLAVFLGLLGVGTLVVILLL
jgi:hypothetical protein